MALEQTTKLVDAFKVKMAVANQVTEVLCKDVRMDDLTHKPTQAVYIAKYALILSALVELASTFTEEASRPENRFLTELEMDPLLVALNNAIRSIDTALQVAGLDVGLKEEWLKC